MNVNLNPNNYNISFGKKSAIERPVMDYSYEYHPYLSMEYRKPVTLKKALYDILRDKKIDRGVIGEKDVIYRFINDLRAQGDILKSKIIKLAGFGARAAVFETEDGQILKLTDGNHFSMKRPAKDFDLPILKSGHKGKTYYYIEEKLSRHDIPDYFVEEMRDMIKAAGLRPHDLYDGDTHQLGLCPKTGKLYLLDPECARYKTVFHALFDKAKRLVKRI